VSVTEGASIVTTPSTLTIDVHLSPGDLEAALRGDVDRGLTTSPKALPPKWFYDDAGSALFEAITRLPEYYPTRREREILDREAAEIARLAAADTLIELGSGTSAKTRLLLDAWAAAGRLRRFVPFDVSETTLRQASAAVAAEYGGIDVHAVVGDFEHHLDQLPAGGRRCVAFLGGTIGNLVPVDRRRFLADLRATLAPGDSLLLGVDLVKDRERLVAAYDDAAGVTAEFNRNVLAVINRHLGADFRPEHFRHIALWDPEREWIEMRLRADRAMPVRVEALDLDVSFHVDEELRTEVSAKFRRPGVEHELGEAGFALARWWTDAAGDFALSLSFAA
jgi:L-histidine N-alpha-methyltransferase